MLREKKTNIFQHYLKKPTLKRNFYKQLNYIIDMKIERTDEQNVVIYIGQSIFEAEIEIETRYDSEPSSFNGLNDKTNYEMYEYEYYKPYNLMRIEGSCNQTDKDLLEELEYKLNR